VFSRHGDCRENTPARRHARPDAVARDERALDGVVERDPRIAAERVAGHFFFKRGHDPSGHGRERRSTSLPPLKAMRGLIAGEVLDHGGPRSLRHRFSRTDGETKSADDLSEEKPPALILE